MLHSFVTEKEEDVFCLAGSLVNVLEDWARTCLAVGVICLIDQTCCFSILLLSYKFSFCLLKVLAAGNFG